MSARGIALLVALTLMLAGCDQPSESREASGGRTRPTLSPDLPTSIAARVEVTRTTAAIRALTPTTTPTPVATSPPTPDYWAMAMETTVNAYAAGEATAVAYNAMMDEMDDFRSDLTAETAYEEEVAM